MKKEKMLNEFDEFWVETKPIFNDCARVSKYSAILAWNANPDSINLNKWAGVKKRTL